MWKNLAAIWPHCAALGDIKIIIPIVIDNDEDLEALKIVIPSKFTICELVAPLEVLNA